MRSCAVFGCTNTVGREKCTFFKLPQDPGILQRWKIALGRDPLPTASVVCANHFTEECIVDKGFRCVLAPGSVPSLLMAPTSQSDHTYARLSPTLSCVPPPSKVVKLDHSYSLPSAVELKSRLDKQVARCEKQRLNAQRQCMANLRLRRKVSKLGDIIHDLENTRMISDKAAEMLSGFADTSVTDNLYNRLSANLKSGGATREAYSPALKAFAMTLSFYSSKAYRYVRETFALALPHPSTITSWYSSINGEPGFSEECLETLKARQLECQGQGGSLYFALTMDEMHLMSRLEYDGHKFRGEVDVGGMDIGDTGVMATQVLVFLVVSVNQSWKLPIGFFFIHGLSGSERANLVVLALSKLEAIGAQVLSLTCDGPNSNKLMMTELGVSLDPESIVPFFWTTGGSKVYVLFDACHMVKLLRNTFEKQGGFLDSSGRKIEWRFLVELVRFQTQQGFRCANKLTYSHVNFHKSKMNVRLAVQLLSASVADALEYAMTYLKLPQFQGCEGTIDFIRRVDRLFDFCNSRNPCVNNYKAPLRKNSHPRWENFIQETLLYFQQLKTPSGILMTSTPRRTGFLGFLLTMKSITGIYYDYVQTCKLKYLLTYKLSQDHVELYFCAVRAGLGSNNNPSCKEFINIFKKLMVRNHVRGWKGNCLQLDDTVILSATSTRPSLVIDAEEVSLYRRLDETIGNTSQMEQDQSFEQEMQWMELLAPAASTINYKDSVLTYLSGFVVKMVMRHLKCLVCASALEAYMSNGLPNNYSLVAHKTHGGLVFASPSVLRICKATERQFALVERENSFMKPQENFLTRHVVVPVVTELVLDAR